METSPQIFFIVGNVMLFKEGHVFLLKCFCPMMLRLVHNVFFDRLAIGHAHRECAVALLPREIFHADGFVNPARRSLFNVLHERRERMCRAQTDEQMNMIRRAADGFRNSIRRANQSAKIFVQSPAPFIRDERMPVFRAEHDVVMQA